MFEIYHIEALDKGDLVLIIFGLNIMQNQGYRLPSHPILGCLSFLDCKWKKMSNSRGQPIRRRSLVSPGPCVKPVAGRNTNKQTNKQISITFEEKVLPYNSGFVASLLFLAIYWPLDGLF
jgi:hypothetical protein